MKNNFWGDYIRLLKHYKCLGFLIISSAIEIVRGAIMTQGVAWGVNWITMGCVEKNEAILIRGLLVFTCSIIYSVIVVHLNSIAIQHKIVELKSNLRKDIVETVLYGEFDVVRQYDKNDIWYRYNNNINDIASLFESIQSFVGSFGKVIGGYIAGFMFSWHLTLILILFGFLKVIIDKYIVSSMSDVYKKRNDDSEKLFSSLALFMKNIYTFRMTADKKRILEEYESDLENVRVVSQKAEIIKINMDSIGSCIEMVVVLSVLGIGAILSVNNIITIGAFTAFISLYDFFVNPYKFISNFVNKKKTHEIGCINVIEILNVPLKHSAEKNEMSIPMTKYFLVLENVDFAYEKGKKVISDLSYTFESGKVTYITGASGVGKSTLVKLIDGILNIQNGQIYVRNFGQKKKEHIVPGMVTYISQTPFLFYGTIAENIALEEKRDIDYSKLRNALKDAGIEEFVYDLPGQEEYIIEDNGKGFSGGEKCRIALARIFYKPTPIILLDEIYASIDNTLIPSISCAINKLCKLNCCILFITHREEWVDHDSNRLMLK